MAECGPAGTKFFSHFMVGPRRNGCNVKLVYVNEACRERAPDAQEHLKGDPRGQNLAMPSPDEKTLSPDQECDEARAEKKLSHDRVSMSLPPRKRSATGWALVRITNGSRIRLRHQKLEIRSWTRTMPRQLPCSSTTGRTLICFGRFSMISKAALAMMSGRTVVGCAVMTSPALS